jgi:hypothetical protein
MALGEERQEPHSGEQEPSLLQLPTPWYNHAPPKNLSVSPPFPFSHELAKQGETALVPPLLPPVPGSIGTEVLPILPEKK